MEDPTGGCKVGQRSSTTGVLLDPSVEYMQAYGPEIGTESSKVQCTTMALEGAVAQWMVTLYNDDALELRNFNQFMVVLRKSFEDPLADCKARDRRGVAKYTQEFCDLVCRLTDWPQDILVRCFKDGLKGAPSTLHGWNVLEEEIEIDLAQNKHCPGWQKSFPEKKKALKLQSDVPNMQQCLTTCFKFRKEGHQVAKYKFDHSTQKMTLSPIKKTVKLPLQSHEMALKGVEVRVHPSPKDGERTLIQPKALGREKPTPTLCQSLLNW